MDDMNENFLTRKRAAAFLDISAKTLERHAADGTGPAYVRVGARRVVYQRSELVRWAKGRQFRSRAQEMAAGGL